MVTAHKDRTVTTEHHGASRRQHLARLAGGLVLWYRRAHTRNELSRLSDRALADLGIVRADISRFARERDPWQRLPGEAVFILALGQLIERAEAWRARRREQARVYRELMAYSDRDLDELGIQRRDIRAISRGA